MSQKQGNPPQPSIFGGKPDYPGTLFNVDLICHTYHIINVMYHSYISYIYNMYRSHIYIYVHNMYRSHTHIYVYN